MARSLTIPALSFAATLVLGCASDSNRSSGDGTLGTGGRDATTETGGQGGRAGSSSGGAGSPSGGVAGAGGTSGAAGAVPDASSENPAISGPSDPACPQDLAGPRLAEVQTAAGSPITRYCMDVTEITNAQYAEFVAAGYATSGQDAWCDWNDTYALPDAEECAPTEGPDHPVVCVDWCDAAAYCQWAGKHMCGEVGGGELAFEDGRDSVRGEWYNACSGSGQYQLPNEWQQEDEFLVCNTLDRINEPPLGTATVPVASLTDCRTAEGVYDLSGNVSEWVASCEAWTGPNDLCRTPGGSYVAGALCGISDPRQPRGIHWRTVGFRCCADALDPGGPRSLADAAAPDTGPGDARAPDAAIAPPDASMGDGSTIPATDAQ